MPDAPAEANILFPWQSKTFGFDMSKEGSVIGGETLSSPQVHWVDNPPLAGAPDIGTPTINALEFYDSDESGRKNKKIPAGKGVICRFSATVGITQPGDYRCYATANTSGGDTITVVGVIRVPTR